MIEAIYLINKDNLKVPIEQKRKKSKINNERDARQMTIRINR